MAMSNHTDDRLTVTPPLNRQEQRYLRGLCSNAAGSIRRPGFHCPWQPADDGSSLVLMEPFGTTQPLAEWAAYLSSHLFGPHSPRLHGRVMKGFTYDHVLTSTVQVAGGAKGDRWTLLAGPEGVEVERTQMPCASCWSEALLAIRPTEAYRFIHPERAANLIDGSLPDFDHDAMEEDCLSNTWTPVGPTRRTVTWPREPYWPDSWWIDRDLTPDAVPFRWGDEPAADDDLVGRWNRWDEMLCEGERRLGDVLSRQGATRPTEGGQVLPFVRPRPGLRPLSARDVGRAPR